MEKFDAFEKTLRDMANDKDFNKDERHMIEAILVMYMIHKTIENYLDDVTRKGDDDDD